ncbi:MAG: zinc ribbon domain-containing protein [Candidatus Omnitrophica bacterium]|nr:zinc ribbon domain-containing protein [Candidatus Omnitrophota bacterium]
MPTYDYRCENCGHRFEKRQSMSDKSLLTCPKLALTPLVARYAAAGGVTGRGRRLERFVFLPHCGGHRLRSHHPDAWSAFDRAFGDADAAADV